MTLFTFYMSRYDGTNEFHGFPIPFLEIEFRWSWWGFLWKIHTRIAEGRQAERRGGGWRGGSHSQTFFFLRGECISGARVVRVKGFGQRQRWTTRFYWSDVMRMSHGGEWETTETCNITWRKTRSESGHVMFLHLFGLYFITSINPFASGIRLP